MVPAELDFSSVVDLLHVVVSSTVNTCYDILFITLPCAQVEKVNQLMAAARISEPLELRAPHVSLCCLLSSQRKFNCTRKVMPGGSC